jgi:hypothetical protein
MAERYSFETKAALKLLLHASKYPSSPISGLLLGTPGDGLITVVDAIPMFHTQACIGPCLDSGLSQVGPYFLGIVGLRDCHVSSVYQLALKLVHFR